MSECNHDCASCASKKDGSCDGEKPAGFAAPANARSHVARVIAVMSGKGGVGKSLVTELLAVQAQKRGLRVAVLDADIAGAVKQFWSDVAWGDVDVMFVDLPPGTGDAPSLDAILDAVLA